MLMVKELVLVAAFSTLAACSGLVKFDVPDVPDLETAPELYAPAVDDEYRFSPGDKLRIVSYYDKQLNQELVVRPDGRISLLLLDEIKVLGMTPSELDRLVSEGYSQVVESPEITVVVDESADRTIYLGGEIQLQSSQNMTTPRTVVQAVTMAGGLLPTANAEQVLIMRRQPDGQFKTYKHNLVRVFNNELPDVYLQRNDIVFVPKTRISDIDLWVEQYINQIIPSAVLVSYQYSKVKTSGSDIQISP